MPTNKSRLTPKAATETKSVRIPLATHTLVYLFARQHGMTFQQAVAHLVGVALLQLYRLNDGEPEQPGTRDATRQTAPSPRRGKAAQRPSTARNAPLPHRQRP
jgi:hypothetical protein